MNTGSEADQVVDMSLKALEVVARISGNGAKNLAVFLYASLKNKNKTKGQARLESMLQSGKELKVFSVRTDDLKTFKEYAKKYGVLYCIVKDRKDVDQMSDIIVRAEDAPKINRIVERFRFMDVKATATVETAKTDPAKGELSKDSVSEFLDKMLGSKDNVVPQQMTEEKVPSDNFSLDSANANMTSKPSVRANLLEITKAQSEVKAEKKFELNIPESKKQSQFEIIKPNTHKNKTNKKLKER